MNLNRDDTQEMIQKEARRFFAGELDTDACRMLVQEAAWLLDQGSSATLEIASAKAFANEAVAKIIIDGQRLHGAIGYSNEYDLQLFTRRARAFCLAYGDTEEQLERAAVALGL